MRKSFIVSRRYSVPLLSLFVASNLLFFSAHAQQTKISDYVIFGANGLSQAGSPGVTMGSASSIQGGIVGSNTLVTSTGNMVINGGIYSGGTILLANSNTVQ